MNKLFLYLILNFMILNTYASPSLSEQIKDKINVADPDINIGIKITNLNTNEVVYELNPNRYYTFASSIKFVTIASLYEYFNSNNNFKSAIYKNNNDYYLDISDPTFSTDDLNFLVKSLIKPNNNSTNISGNFYIVDNKFSLPPIIRTKAVLDNFYCYGAPITKVHINKNCIRLMAKPNNIGEKITLTKQKIVPYDVLNTAVTIPNNELDRINTTIKDNKLIVSGSLSHQTGEVPIAVTINDNLDHIKRILDVLLKQNKITLKGKILHSSTPSPGNSNVIVSKSTNFKELASMVLKKSDNFIADYLLAEFARKESKTIYWEEATRLLKRKINDNFKVDFTKSEISDGSGLSRTSISTVNQFSNFLNSVANKPFFNDLLPLMCIPGEEGMLKNRFDDAKELKLFAKTGGLQFISSLVGYFYNQKNQLYSFVIVINNHLNNDAKYEKLIDDIVKIAAQY